MDFELFNFSLPDYYLKANLTELLPKLNEYFGSEKIFNSEEEALIILIYILLSILGVISNLFIMYVIFKLKKLGTAVNMLVINLNLSDILLCVVCMPITLVQILRRHWSFGLLICKSVAFVQGITVFVSAMTISAIAILRLLIITSGQRKLKQLNERRILLISLIWIIAGLLSLPVSINHSDVEIKVAGVYLYNRCLETWSLEAKTWFSFITLIFQLIMPTSLLVTCHLKIKFHLRETSRNNSSGRDALNDAFKESRERNERALANLFRVWLAFLLSWLPWNVINLYFDYTADSNLTSQELYSLFAGCHLVAMSSATTNAILYGWLNTNIKNEISLVKHKLISCFRRARQPKEISETPV
ncbi:neuropeptide F receptor-like protein [Dinothrombium tinctorium]|uniref:Neuropeptide F receptor-like protein n=1 Tax=Dinothrombium tinctorium TaxID=1965070 RepID=A0A443QQ13_9ACAR|nr:neuropeptide F receptor-like protein [Dinothrombium tinctorium]